MQRQETQSSIPMTYRLFIFPFNIIYFALTIEHSANIQYFYYIIYKYIYIYIYIYIKYKLMK